MFELDMVHPSMSDLSTVVCARNPVSNASKITRVQHLDGRVKAFSASIRVCGSLGD